MLSHIMSIPSKEIVVNVSTDQPAEYICNKKRYSHLRLLSRRCL